jgi:hypothetical protein
MAKLYATLENSKGKQVSISDNEEITATVYDGNMKAYSITISFTDIGDIIDNDGNELPKSEKTKGAIITTREWRNREQTNDRKKCKKEGCIYTIPCILGH